MSKPELVCELFMRYATRSGSMWLMYGTGLRRLLRDMEAVEGVPPDHVDAYVRQVLLRADSDRDGALSLEEFVLWFASELAALPPLTWRDAGQCLYYGNHRLRTVFNRFVAVCSLQEGRQGQGLGQGRGPGHAWGDNSARRQAPGATSRQLLDLLRAAKVVGGGAQDEGLVAAAVKLAQQGVRADRVSGQVEDTNHLPLALFIRSLVHVAAKRHGVAHVLLQLMSADGTPPPSRLPPPPPPGEDNELLDNLFMVSTAEYTRWSEHTQQARSVLRGQMGWRLPLDAFQTADGGPLTTRGLRAVFHRYCAKWNKCPMPPPDMPRDAPAPWATANQQQQQHQHQHQLQHQPAADAVAPPLESPWSWYWGACSCCFRSLSTMELNAWMRLCGDNRAVQDAILSGHLTPHRVEHVFVYAGSIAGVYLSDDSTGVHDLPVTGREAERELQLQLPRGKPASPAGRYGAVGKSLESLRHSLPTCQLGAMHLATAWLPLREPAVAGEEGGTGSPLASPKASTGGAAPGSPRAGLRSARGTESKRRGHRAPVLSLTFVQFLEALRLLAEEAVGHPATNNKVNAVLLYFMYGLTDPRPDTTNCDSLMATQGRPSSAPRYY